MTPTVRTIQTIPTIRTIQTHPTMKRILLPLALLALLAPSASATLLLYDGFATATDAQSRTPYLSSADTHKLTDANAKSDAWTTGLSQSYPWSQSSGVIFTFRNAGLALPADFAEGTGDQFSARGGSAGFSNTGTNFGTDDGSNNDMRRAKNRAITSTMPTSGMLYYRCLMKIDTTAFNALKATSWKYYGTGISTHGAENAYNNQTNLRDNGLRVAFTGVPAASSPTGSATVGIYANIGGQAHALVGSVSAGTTYIVIVELDYATGKAKAYASPISNYSKSFAWTVEDITPKYNTVVTSAMRVMFIDGHYQTNGGKVMFDEIAVGTELADVAVVTPATAPQLGAVSLARTGTATYAVTAEVLENAADTVSWIADAGTAATTNAFATAVATNTTASGTVSGLAADTTYQISALAENVGSSDEKTAGTIYTGSLSLGATTDADEYGLVAGGVTVSRAAADPFPLTVNYTISGSAGTEGTTWAAPIAVTIPAGSASATLPVVPLMDGDVNADVTITVTLAAGNYEIPAAASAQLTLVNLAAPAGKKTWIAAADGLASDGANWTPSGAPGASDDILFDGNFSNARCTWDSAAGHAVASWTQTAAYTGTIDFDTTYDDGDFPVFAIAGDATVNGGKWTHRANAAVQTNRLSVTVGGDFTVGSGVQITASNKGYAANKFPAGSAIGVHGGSVNDITKVYGDFKHPVDIGSGGGTANMTGGGAIHIVVTGDATIDGTLAANPNQGSAQNAIGAGGSIYLQAASVAGSGSITAAGSTADATLNDGAGGRIAVVCTTATELSFPKANFRCNGSTGGYGHSSGGGTIFVKTASQQNGTLIVTHNILGITYVRWFPTKRGVTPIPAGKSWALDTLEFRGYGVLCVPSGTSLSVPLSGISSASTREAGILYEGGAIDFGSAPYTLSGNWTFCADAPYTFDGDVTVQGGANLGGFKFSGHYTNDFAKCDVTVDGDLVIASGGYATVELCGPNEANATAACGGGFPMHGGQMATVSGNHCYDSVFDPAYPGHFARNGDQGNVGVGGGALKLTVTGDLVVDGRISADGTVRSKSSAAAGSVNITAKTLSGTGSITATGKPGSLQWDPGYNGVGGRVAVRVTDEDVGSTGIWTKFAARGCATNQVNTANERNQNSSAGTIYLQGASDGEKGGTIYVKNQASYDTSNVATWLPAGTLGDAAEDFKKAKLVIADRGVVAVDAPTFRLASVSIEANSRFELHGNKVVVTDAFLDGAKCPYGTFTAESSAVAGYVFDSVGGGTFVVTGRGTVLIVK